MSTEKSFVSLYKPPRPLPHVCIVDPNTGECMKVIDIKAKFDNDLRSSFHEQVSAFLGTHRLDATGVYTSTQPPVAPHAKQKAERSIIDCSEDEQLAAAIAASMKETSVDLTYEDSDDDVVYFHQEEEGEDADGGDNNGVEVVDCARPSAQEKEEDTEAASKYPALDDEVEAGNPNATMIQFRLAGPVGRAKRRFDKTRPVSQLYAFINETFDEGKEFDLELSYPRRSLAPDMEKSLEEAGILNCLVIKKML